MSSFTTKRTVEFRDTDAAGIMHFSVFFNWMEECEHEMLRAAGMSVMMENGDHHLSWPRVSAHCDFKSPVCFENVVDVSVSIEHIGNKSIKYAIDFSHAGEPVATGHLVAVCCEVRENQPPKAVSIPDDVRAKLEKYCA